MQLRDLIRKFRALATDTHQPYLWEDPDVIDWLNEGQDEACKRGRLLREEVLPGMCQIALEPGKHTYPLHEKAYEIIHLQIRPGSGSAPRPITLKSREWLDSECPRWREDPNPACIAIQDERSLRLVGMVELGDRLELEVYRLPLKPMACPTDAPEIHEGNHSMLIEWALHKAYSIPDSDTIDLQRSAAAEAKFTAHFGLPVDSDMRRATRIDVAHHMQLYLA